jgi:hypothetical protein
MVRRNLGDFKDGERAPAQQKMRAPGRLSQGVKPSGCVAAFPLRADLCQVSIEQALR